MSFKKFVLLLITISSTCFAHSSHKQCHPHVYTRKPKVTSPAQVTNLSRLSPSLDCLKLNNRSDLTGFAQYHNVSFDPQIAINPTNPLNIIILAQQDTLANANYSTAMPLAVIVIYTMDGGITWNQSDIVWSRCQGATNYRAPNNFAAAYLPTVSFDPEGSCYVYYNGYNVFPADQKSAVNMEEANIVAKSIDGGISWNHVSTTMRDDGLCHFSDFPFIKADPYRKHTLYVVTSDDTCFVEDKCTDPGYTGTQNITFQKSTDAGSSWMPVSQIAAFTPEDPLSCTPIPILHQLEVLPDCKKTLLLTSMLQSNSPDGHDPDLSDRILAWRSEDGGDTWDMYPVAENIPHVLAIDPDAFDPILPVTDFTTKDMAVNRCNGHIYIVYSDPQFNPTGQAGCAIRMSKDGGKTWSDPQPINPKSLDVQTFLPTVAVARDGTVGVLFYDFRNFTHNDPKLSTDVWMAFFNKDLDHYYGEVRLTPESFDTRQSIRGYNGVDQPNCLFDYYLSVRVGLKADKNDFIASFVVTTDFCEVASIGTFPCDSFPLSTDDCNRQNVMYVRVKRH